MKVTETSFLLRASTIDTTGVGCFASEDIDKGTRLYLNGANLNRQLEETEIPESHLKYCPRLESGLYLAPENFACMSVFWFINHAREPNVGEEAWKLYTQDDIAAGEELTVYYPDLLTHPSNAEWVVPELHV